MVYNGTSSSCRLVDCIGLWLCVFSFLFIKFFFLHPSLYFLVSWAWLDWPLTWLTNYRRSVLWHCCFGHLTHKIVSKMTYNVSSGTLNPTIPILWQNLAHAYYGERPLYRNVSDASRQRSRSDEAKHWFGGNGVHIILDHLAFSSSSSSSSWVCRQQFVGQIWENSVYLSVTA